jgi:hypothetical protein
MFFFLLYSLNCIPDLFHNKTKCSLQKASRTWPVPGWSFTFTFTFTRYLTLSGLCSTFPVNQKFIITSNQCRSQPPLKVDSKIFAEEDVGGCYGYGIFLSITEPARRLAMLATSCAR